MLGSWKGRGRGVDKVLHMLGICFHTKNFSARPWRYNWLPHLSLDALWDCVGVGEGFLRTCASRCLSISARDYLPWIKTSTIHQKLH